MNNLKYLIQFIFIIFFFLLFKIIRLRLASFVGGKIFELIGPIFRSKKLIYSNIQKAFPKINNQDLTKITLSMWNNYGRVFAEYMFMKNFRNNETSSNVKIIGYEIREYKKK